MAPAPHISDPYIIEAQLVQAGGFLCSQLVQLGVDPAVATRVAESWRAGAARELETLLAMASMCVAPTPAVARRAREP